MFAPLFLTDLQNEKIAQNNGSKVSSASDEMKMDKRARKGVK